MTLSRAFDLAQWVNEPANVNDGVVVSALGPPFQGQFKPVVIEAPTDGYTYSRQNAAWVVVASGGGGGVTDAPNDGTGYIRQSAAWINVIDAGTF
jgi:hypothetical protein